MKQDAEAHAADDKKRRELVDLKNQGDALVYQTEKQMKEHGEKVPADVRGQIESAVNSLKDALKGDDGDAIKKTIESLNAVQHKLAEEIYKNTAASGAQAGQATADTQSADQSSSTKKDEDVIDAEYEVKDNK